MNFFGQSNQPDNDALMFAGKETYFNIERTLLYIIYDVLCRRSVNRFDFI